MNAQPTLFDGATYDPALDADRLSTALGRIYQAFATGRWLTLAELATIGQCSEAAASARVRDLRKYRYGTHLVERKRIRGGLWAYRMLK